MPASPFPSKNERQEPRRISGERICIQFNKFSRSYCQRANNRCSKGLLHKCSVCEKYRFKAIRHLLTKTNFDSTRRRIRHPSVSQAQVNSCSVEPFEKQDHNVLQAISDKLDSLSVRMEHVEAVLPQSPTPRTPDQQQDHLFGLPAISSLPSALGSSVSLADLAGKHILWTKVSSAGVSLPLPLDTGCSISLVSENQTKTVARNCPTLTFTKSEHPIVVSAACPSSQLQAVGIMQVPIVWDSGITSTFSMLVVPNLSWPILFGQNHLSATNAQIYSYARTVYFGHDTMKFTVRCSNTNPLTAFPSLSSLLGSPTSPVSCLVTAIPTPDRPISPIQLAKGFNLISVCLVIAASLVGSSLFSAPLWLEGCTIAPGVTVLSAPICLSHVPSVISPGFDVAAFFSPTRPRKPHLGPPVLTVCSDVHHDQHSVDSFPPDEVYFTQLVVRSTQVKFTLPFNALLGSVHAQSAETDIIHKDAADFTAANLADIWHSFAVHCDLPNVYPVVSTTHTPNNVDKTEFLTNVRPTQNISNNNQTCNDSSILSQFLENSPREPDHALPPESMSNIDVFSEEYYLKLVDALDLNTAAYSHVPPDIISKFCALIRKYPQVFYLPDTPLSTIKGFQHNIDTGEARPVYRLPYRKSPAELAAIKQKILNHEHSRTRQYRNCTIYIYLY